VLFCRHIEFLAPKTEEHTQDSLLLTQVRQL